MPEKFTCTYCLKEFDETDDYYAIVHYPKADQLGPIRTVDEVDVFDTTDCVKKYASTIMT